MGNKHIVASSKMIVKFENVVNDIAIWDAAIRS